MECIFQLINVTYRYKKDKTAALNQISFSLPKWRKTAIVGPNGAGKSTLLFHLNGLFLCESGEVLFNGEPLTKANQSDMVRRVGLVFQDPDDQIISMTVKDDIAFGPAQLGCTHEEIHRRVEQSMELLDISHLAELNPAELSYGQKKQVAIAGVLAMETEVVIFDEPMAFLDPRGKKRIKQIMDLLIARGKTVIAATHDMQFVAEWADHVIVVKDGTCMGSMDPRQLFSDQTGLLEAAHLEVPIVASVFFGLLQEQESLPVSLDEARMWVVKHKGSHEF